LNNSSSSITTVLDKMHEIDKGLLELNKALISRVDSLESLILPILSCLSAIFLYTAYLQYQINQLEDQIQEEDK